MPADVLGIPHLYAFRCILRAVSVVYLQRNALCLDSGDDIRTRPLTPFVSSPSRSFCVPCKVGGRAGAVLYE